MTSEPKLMPSVALAAYLEALVQGRRVLVFGDATSALTDHLLNRGARLVHVYDPDPGRVTEAQAQNTSRSVHFAPLSEGSLALREGAFDAAIVENVAAIGDVDKALGELRRALSTRGVALIACANPEVELRLLPDGDHADVAIDYYSLYDAVSQHFEHVRMLGQTPFVGYAVVDFAPDSEPLPSLDTASLPGGAEEPEWYVALASPRAMLLDEFAIVQLPFAATLRRGQDRGGDELLRAARASERRARQRLVALEAENKRLSRLRGFTSARSDSAELERLRRELKRRDDWIAQLEARAEAADARADDVQQQADEALARLQAEREELAQRPKPIPDDQNKEETLQQLETELASLKTQLAEKDSKLIELKSDVEKRNRQIEMLSGVEDVDHSAELSALESQLSERGEEIRRVQADLKQAEQLGRELIRELEDLRQNARLGELSQDNPEASRLEASKLGELERQLAQLAEANARCEADLAAAGWTIEELEGRLKGLSEH